MAVPQYYDDYTKTKKTTKAPTTPKNPFLPSYYPTFPETKPLAPDLTGRTSVKPTTTQGTLISTQYPKTQQTYTPAPVVQPTPQRDIASEIAAEMSKEIIDWAKVGQLSTERDAKIASLGVQTQSTSDYIDQLYANRQEASKPGTLSGLGMQYRPDEQYPGTPPPAQENQYMQPDYTQYLIDMVTNQFKYNNQADINAIRQAYEQGRGQLQGQIPGVHQNARSAYDANDAYYHTQALPELRAAMEQAGLYRGGDMLGGNVDLLTMRGQNAGQISQDQMNQLNAIQQAISQLNIDEGLKVAEVEAANNAAEAQALINAANMGMQNQLAVGELTGNIMGTDTLSKIQQAYNQAMGIADRTGNMPDGSQTLSAQQQAADLAYRQQQFDESVRQFNANYGIDLKRLSLDQVQQELDNKYRMGQLSLQQKNQALNEAQFVYQKEQDLLNNNSPKTVDTSKYMQEVIRMYTETDPISGQQKYPSQAIIAYIGSLPLDNEQKISFVRNLPIPAAVKASIANMLGL